MVSKTIYNPLRELEQGIISELPKLDRWELEQVKRFIANIQR